MTVKMLDKNLSRIQKELALSQEDLAHILGISSRNLARWLKGEVEAPGETYLQNIQALQEILEEGKKAVRVDKLSLWFRTPNPVLADLRPLDLLASRAGQDKVKSLLGRIRWGIPA